MHFPYAIEAFKNPNILVEEIDAFSHSSQCQNGILNLQEGQDSDSVMVGSGAVVTANKI